MAIVSLLSSLVLQKRDVKKFMYDMNNFMSDPLYLFIVPLFDAILIINKTEELKPDIKIKTSVSFDDMM